MRLVTVSLLMSLSAFSHAARIKDIASLKGARSNQLLGYGIVVGLSGTGDKSSELTESSVGLALKGIGIDLKSKVDTKNTAAVICSVALPPFSKNGAALDVTVSSLGNATSLDGGNLVATALRGADGSVYAIAQGKLITTKRQDLRATNQTYVTANVPGGAILEKEINYEIASQRELRYHLHQPDFTTAARMAIKINEELGGKFATAGDAGTVDVSMPQGYDGTTVDLLAQLENLDVETDRVAKVVINPRTSTVILGSNVRIAPVAIAHNNLKIEIKDPKEAKPAKSKSVAKGKMKAVHALSPGPNVADIASALNDIGASAEDLVSILQSLKASGALIAELEVQ